MQYKGEDDDIDHGILGGSHEFSDNHIIQYYTYCPFFHFELQLGFSLGLSRSY